MDPKTYDDTVLRADLVGDAKDYIVENLAVTVLYAEGRPVEIELPSSVHLKIAESADGVRGDSANNVQKTATLETGKVIHVPLFIKGARRSRSTPARAPTWAARSVRLHGAESSRGGAARFARRWKPGAECAVGSRRAAMPPSWRELVSMMSNYPTLLCSYKTRLGADGAAVALDTAGHFRALVVNAGPIECGKRAFLFSAFHGPRTPRPPTTIRRARAIASCLRPARPSRATPSRVLAGPRPRAAACAPSPPRVTPTIGRTTMTAGRRQRARGRRDAGADALGEICRRPAAPAGVRAAGQDGVRFRRALGRRAGFPGDGSVVRFRVRGAAVGVHVRRAAGALGEVRGRRAAAAALLGAEQDGLR